MYFFPDEEGKSREKHLYSTVNGKVSQSPQNFFFLKNKYFKNSAIDITFSQQNLGDKLLKVKKK